MSVELSSETRVRVKPIYPVYRLTETRFRIGAQRGVTGQITDPKAHMWTLVSLLDGDRPLGEVVAAFRARFPDIGADEVLAAVRELDGRGFLEDAAPTAYDTDGQLVRYLGNVNYFSHFGRIDRRRDLLQDRLRGSRCVLFGLGGGGSYILPLLLAVGFGEVVAVDYDRVEASNLNRQLLFRERDVGRPKTAVAVQVAAELNSDVRFTAVQRRIDTASQVAELVRGADVAICAIDEPPFMAQRRVNAGCVAEGVPYVCGGSFITRGRVFTVVPGRTGCLDCLHLHYMRTDEGYLTQLAAGLRLDMGQVTVAFAPHIAMIASLIAGEAVRLVTGHADLVAANTQLELDYETGRLERVTTWPRDPEGCPVCGEGAAADAFDVWHEAPA